MTRSTPIRVTVVIPNWNNVDLLTKCLDSLMSQFMQAFEVIIVDNGSTDFSAAYVSKHYPTVRLVINTENKGFCTAMNQGARLAKGDFLLLLNNDTELDRFAIKRMATALATAPPSVLGVFPKVVFSDEPCVINSLGVVWNRSQLWRDLRVGQLDYGQYQSGERVFGSIFAAVMVKARAFQSIGAFDEAHFSYGEDFDFCYRANAFGYTFLTVPSSLVKHKHRASSGDKSNREWAYYYYLRNYLYVVLKNYELHSLMYRGPAVLWKLLGRGLLSSIRRRNRVRIATHLRAAYGLVGLLPRAVQYRRFIKRHRVRSDSAIWDRSKLPGYNPYYYEDAVVLGTDALRGYSESWGLGSPK